MKRITLIFIILMSSVASYAIIPKRGMRNLLAMERLLRFPKVIRTERTSRRITMRFSLFPKRMHTLHTQISPRLAKVSRSSRLSTVSIFQDSSNIRLSILRRLLAFLNSKSEFKGIFQRPPYDEPIFLTTTILGTLSGIDCIYKAALALVVFL